MIKDEYCGTAWTFGDDITTDDILPGQYLDHKNDEVGAFALAGIDPSFAKRVCPGDIIVAGKNFGVGSGRETAVFAIQQAGIPVIVAESFARLFFRNAINNGLLPVMISSTRGIETGHRLRVDIIGRTVTNLVTGEQWPILNLTGISLDILRAGGIIPFIEQRLHSRA